MGETAEEHLRLGLLGPVLPYRGGIAQHTTMLHRALSPKADLRTVSFTRQYPRLLYPGRDDIAPEYRGHREPGVFYLLDSLNPFTWVETCRRLVRHSPAAVIIPWWTFFWGPCFGFIAGRMRQRHARIIFLCHNIAEHEPSYWKQIITRKVLSKGDFFMVHSNSERDVLRTLLPDARIRVRPHPVLRHFPRETKGPARRARLELLFYGFVRPYKGLDVLLEAMRMLRNEDLYLSVVGEWWKKSGHLRNMLDKRDLKDRIEIVDRYVTEEETAGYFSRADVVVLPYRSASSSGVIPLAYGYGKPVIATRVGGLPEVVVDGVSGRLIAPADPHALADAVREFMQIPPDSMRGGVEKVSAGMTWESFADDMLYFMRSS
jgi:glycosyltransferase involved in cell wall biosynthesis